MMMCWLKFLVIYMTIFSIYGGHKEFLDMQKKIKQEINIYELIDSFDVRYLYQDKPPTKEETFDFIIVGSGSAGAVVANRLSENPNWNILLLEVGDVATAFTEMPLISAVFQYTKLDWDYTAEREEGYCWGCPNRRMHWPRGRALGGTTALNYMIHVRGNPLDYDKWEAMGNPGWGYKDVLPYFKKLEDANIEIQDTGYHNKGGYMTVGDIPYRTEASHAFVKAAQQAGHPYVDYNGKTQLGVSYIQGNVRNGKRCGVEKAYLRPIRNRKNLKVLINSRVIKVLIDPETKEARGVIYVRGRKYYKILAKKEVILSAGAFNSPQLLMLSGIGPEDHLKELGVAVIQNLPVGQKMYDHITFVGLNFIAKEPLETVKVDLMYNISNTLEFIINGKGPFTTLGGVEAISYIQTNNSKDPEPYPDMELLFIGASIASDKGSSNRQSLSVNKEVYDTIWKPLENENVWQVYPMLVHPKSYGFLKLKSKNPFQWPVFYPRYFTDPENDDIKTFIAAIREVQRINQQPTFRRLRSELYTKPIPGCEQHTFNSDAYWECALRSITPTLHHQVATCKMGPSSDPEAVVNHRLQVHGIQRLRVVDTSIIPIPISAHVSIPAVMIGEKASDIIKEDWMKKMP